MSTSTTERPVIRVESVTRVFGGGRGRVLAVDDVSLELPPNTIASIVGESGSGKTTLARMMLGLLRPSAGAVYYAGTDIAGYDARRRRQYWRSVQGIFQDPYSSFNQFFRVRKILNDAFKLWPQRPARREREERMAGALAVVNLKAEEVLRRYPFELSGGQAQRLMIARIFLINPAVLVADEPTSMIDACSRASILEALMRLREEQGTSILFVTHDMGLAYYVSDALYIMSKGRIVESGPAQRVMENPQDPYTRRLLADVPRLHEEWL
ncbi:MAG: ABC transporter ATP-binding protein [Candidatus Brocadiae bacterium]|nr:ABC transporter ATP-binding protein [Candidatus Brocadiia bacterium]